MVKLTRIYLILALVFVPFFTQAAQRVVIFVPGFFNSFAPEYFSDAIIETMQAKGFKVIVSQHLNPVGTIEDNGERVLQIFTDAHAQNPDADIDVVGHSAGGLYALYAINKGARYIKNLITVSTPFNGLEFIESWNRNVPGFTRVTELIYLQGLQQLTTPFVQNFLASLRVPSTLKIISYGGYQPVSFNIFDAANMSAVLSFTAAFIPTASDGIVSFKSATATTLINTTEKTVLVVRPNLNSYIPLEHWEQVLDYRNFILLGTPNIGIIRDRQIKFYSKIADQLNAM